MAESKIGGTRAEFQPNWPERPVAPEGVPNSLLLLFDDVRFPDFGCFGYPSKTPTIAARAIGPGL